MANVYQSTAITMRDYKGYQATLKFTLVSAVSLVDLSSQAAALATALNGVSNAIVVKQTGASLVIQETLAYGTAAEYADIGQKLTIRGLGADGRIHKISVPCPKVNQFLTDQTTWDSTVTASATLKTLLNTNWVSADGDEVAITVIDGVFTDRRRKKRLGPLTRTPIGGAAGG